MSQHVKGDSSLWDVRESTKREVLLKEIVINAEIFVLSNKKNYTPENLMSEKPNQSKPANNTLHKSNYKCHELKKNT